MDQKRWQRIKALFSEASELSTQQQVDFVSAQASSVTDLLNDEQLLNIGDEVENF